MYLGDNLKYLTFDIECCDGHHICEFGYVIYDEFFHIVERDCLLINPEHKIKLSGSNEEGDIELAFSQEEYDASPDFAQRYDKIKEIITTPDCLIIGFSLQNDCGFLATAYELYNKEPIKFEYIDFQKLYRGYSKAKTVTSVANMVKELGIENIQLHKSDDDSYAVMLALKHISEKEKLGLPETIELLKQHNKEYKKEIAKERNEKLIEKVNSGNDKAQREYLKTFIRHIKIDKKINNSFFQDKAVCINATYQKEHFNEFISLIYFLHLNGATYTGKASDCNILICANCQEDDKRLVSAKQAISDDNKDILIITLETALKELKVGQKEISQKQYVKPLKQVKKHINAIKHFESNGSVSILEMMEYQKKRVK